MADGTLIEWADATFNPWLGCTRLSPACDHCYAASWAKRTGSPELWQGERRRTSASNWQQPRKWNREAEAAGIRKRVFCASLADVFDNQVPEDWRRDLWELIASTPHLDWLLLTKRPQNIAKMLPSIDECVGLRWPEFWSWPWPNVWLGTTVENQEEADRRIQHLLEVPARVHFLSCEPLLGALDPRHVGEAYEGHGIDALATSTIVNKLGARYHHNRIDWVIAGGESGPGARPAHPDWFRSLRDQCAAAGVPFFFKQMTKKAPIPDDLFIREFP